MLERNYYLDNIMRQVDSWKVKTLVGVRGSGKTTLLHQIMKRIKSVKKADDFHIIYINLEHFEYEKVRDADVLRDTILKNIKDNQNYYIFIEEIVRAKDFEITLDDFRRENPNFSFFVTCSTIRFSTPFASPQHADKYIVYNITPFTFSETCKILNTDARDKNMLLNYLKYGGLPGRFRFKRSAEVKEFIYSALDSIFLRDIISQSSSTNLLALNLTLSYIASQIGNTFLPFLPPAPNMILEQNISYETYVDTIGLLKRALIIDSLDNYYVQYDKSELSEKRFYFSDFGFAYIRGFNLANSLSAALKNLVYLELKQRGYKVYTGLNVDYDIDFVAIHDDEFMYIHVIDHIKDGKSFQEEAKRFDDFEAHGPKYILSLEKGEYIKDGVIRKNIIDFLLDKKLDIMDDYQRDYFVLDESLILWMIINGITSF